MAFDVVLHAADVAAGPLCIVAEDVAPFDAAVAAAVDGAGTVGAARLLAAVEESACVVVAEGVAVACAEVAEKIYNCKYYT